MDSCVGALAPVVTVTAVAAAVLLSVALFTNVLRVFMLSTFSYI